MLSWLDNFFSSAVSTIGQGVSNVVHWAVHALASVVFSVFGLVGKAWDTFYSGVTAIDKAVTDFGLEVWRFAQYVIRTAIPALMRWAEKELAALSAALALIGRQLVTDIENLTRFVEHSLSDLTKWVLRNIYDPLKSYADQIAADLRKWGYTAWWYVTHPDALAEVLVFHLAASMERHAWDLADILGKFIVALIVRNIAKLATLAEDIITAVF